MKQVLYMAEGMGMYTKGIKDKDLAVKAMRAEAEHEHDVDPNSFANYYNFSPGEITNETVYATWYYQHRACESESIGDDNTCYSCGETIGTNGRPTFAFLATP